MDRAGDLWSIEASWPGQDQATSRLRCRHELGYELVVTVSGGALDDRSLVEAVERARRSGPAEQLSEAA